MRRGSIALLGVLLVLGGVSVGLGRAIETRVRADLPDTARPPVRARLLRYERGWFESSFEAEWTQPGGPRLTSRVRVAHGPIPWAAVLDDVAALLPAAAWVRSEIQILAADGSALGRIPRLPPFVATTRVGLRGRSGRVVVEAYEAPLAGEAWLRVQPGSASWSEGPGSALHVRTEWPAVEVASGASILRLEAFESDFASPDWRSPLPLGQTEGRIASVSFGTATGSLGAATGLRFRDERRSEQGRLAWSSHLEADAVSVLGQALRHPQVVLEAEHIPVVLVDALQGLSAGLAAGPEAKASTWEADLAALQRQLESQEAPPRLRAALSGELEAGAVALDARAWLASTARLEADAVAAEAELRVPRAWIRGPAGAGGMLGLVPGGGLLAIPEIWSDDDDGLSVTASFRLREGRVTVSGMPLDFLQKLSEERRHGS